MVVIDNWVSQILNHICGCTLHLLELFLQIPAIFFVHVRQLGSASHMA